MPLKGRAQPGQEYATPPSPGRKKQVASRFGAPDPSSLTVNAAVEAHYQRARSEAEHLSRKSALKRVLGRERKKANRLLKKLEADLEKSGQAAILSRKGEALKANLAGLKKGLGKVTLPDPFDPRGPALELELDPALTPVENMKRLFQKSRRLAASSDRLTGRLDECRKRLSALDALTEQIEEAKDGESLDACDQAFEEAGLVRPVARSSLCRAPLGARRKKKPKARRPYREYRSKNGKVILVGRSGRDNHQLTFRVAKGSDMWFHAQNTPGAHVVVRLDKSESIDEQTLLDAATLAAVGSPAKDDDKVEVTYTAVKHVHPIKGAPAGLVSVAKGRTILVRMEPGRLQRLRNSMKE
jgi:predicted ribosome quality control (RQC) complex YloA/Tae2 family protein